MREDVVYGKECACLYANSTVEDRCLKRYYQILLPDVYELKYVAICNDYVRLRLADFKIKKEYSYSNDASDARKVICEIIAEELNIKKEYLYADWRNHGSNELFDREVSFEICDRPNMYLYYPMREAIEKAMTSGRPFRSKVVSVIRDYIETIEYKKYKTKYKSLFPILKKIKSESREEYLEILFSELLVTILQVNVKNK